MGVGFALDGRGTPNIKGRGDTGGYEEVPQQGIGVCRSQLG